MSHLRRAWKLDYQDGGVGSCKVCHVLDGMFTVVMFVPCKLYTLCLAYRARQRLYLMGLRMHCCIADWHEGV